MTRKITLRQQIEEIAALIGEPIRERASVAELRLKRREAIKATLEWLSANEAAVRAAARAKVSWRGAASAQPDIVWNGEQPRRPKGLSRALAASGGARSAPLTTLSAGAFGPAFQTMAGCALALSGSGA
ncbi:MAG TPA: hypothetical protein VKU03_10575 [Roseiarcus sp.]|nr:hypothetical protein [Roseiarcus sp.]